MVLVVWAPAGTTSEMVTMKVTTKSLMARSKPGKGSALDIPAEPLRG